MEKTLKELSQQLNQKGRNFITLQALEVAKAYATSANADPKRIPEVFHAVAASIIELGIPLKKES